MYKRGFKSWCEKTSLNIRQELGLQVTDPIDPQEIAAHLNIQVWYPENIGGLSIEDLSILTKTQSSSWSAVTVGANGKTIIVINSSHSKARQNSNLTHELSHIILRHEPSKVAVTVEGMLLINTFNKSYEEEADWLSGCLLLPRDALFRIHYNSKPLNASARQYNVSTKMLQWRLNVTGVKKIASY